MILAVHVRSKRSILSSFAWMSLGFEGSPTVKRRITSNDRLGTGMKAGVLRVVNRNNTWSALLLLMLLLFVGVVDVDVAPPLLLMKSVSFKNV